MHFLYKKYLFTVCLCLWILPQARCQSQIENLEERARVLLEQHEYASALAILNLITDIDSTNSIAYQNKGAILMRNLGDTLGALENTDLSIFYDPNNVEAYVNKATLEYFLKNYESSLKAIDKAMALGRKDAETFAIRACTYSALKNYEKSMNDFDKAFQFNPHSDTLYVQKAEAIQYMLSDPNKSIPVLDEGLKKFPESLYILETRALFNNKKQTEEGYKKVIADFDVLLRIAPADKHGRYYYFRGLTKAELGDKAGACADMNQARTLGLGEAFLYLHGNCQEIIQDDVFQADMLAYDADLCFGKGFHERAIFYLTKAIKLNPENHFYYYQRARNKYMIKLYEAAIEDLELSLNLKPDYAWTLCLYGQCVMMFEDQKEQSDFSLAKEYFKNAIKSDPAQAEFYYHLSLLCMDTEDYKSAELYLDKLIALAPNESEVYLIRGDNYVLLNESAKACESFEQANRLGNAQAAQRMLENCKP